MAECFVIMLYLVTHSSLEYYLPVISFYQLLSSYLKIFAYIVKYTRFSISAPSYILFAGVIMQSQA